MGLHHGLIRGLSNDRRRRRSEVGEQSKVIDPMIFRGSTGPGSKGPRPAGDRHVGNRHMTKYHHIAPTHANRVIRVQFDGQVDEAAVIRLRSAAKRLERDRVSGTVGQDRTGGRPRSFTD